MCQMCDSQLSLALVQYHYLLNLVISQLSGLSSAYQIILKCVRCNVGSSLAGAVESSDNDSFRCCWLFFFLLVML
jgi:hypothetical protein